MPAAARVAALLAAAPALKLLVTSREPLKLRLEHRLPVTGLALPGLRTPNPAALMQASAAVLFLEHARRIQPDLVLTPADVPALAALLHRLDGLPLATLMGDYPQPRALLEEALALAGSLRDPALTVRVRSRLGRVTALQGDASDARALLERSVALGREAGVPETGVALVNLGRTFALLEDLERAEATVTEGLNLARTVGRTHLTVFALINLALLKLRRRDYTAAASLGSEALRLARPVEFRWNLNYLMVIAAEIGGHRGDVERAARLLAAVDSWSEWTGEVVSPWYHDPAAYAALRTRARQQTGEVAYRAVVAEVQAMSVNQVAGWPRRAFSPPHRAARTGPPPPA